MYLYHIVSIVKLIVGLGLLLLVYNFINVYQDPVIGIGLGFLGLFIFFWGSSFFIFLFFQNIFRKIDKDRIIKDSYKLSLLFGIYSMINVLLILLGYWTKLLGFVLIIMFVILQILLFTKPKNIYNDQG